MKTRNQISMGFAVAVAMALAPAAYGWHAGHASKHGGVVSSIGDSHLHVEIAVKPGRRYEVYFSDSAQQDLPAAKFSAVALAFSRPGAAVQALPLQLSEDGEFWTATGGPTQTSAKTMVKVTCTYRGAALSKDVALFAPEEPETHAHGHTH